jgi:hypothetical protein
MRFRAILLALPWTAIVAPASVWAASVGEKWEAVSTTAMAITGDLIFSPDRITFGNGKSLPLAPFGTVPTFSAPMESVNATLYRVTTPGDPVLLHGNRLCGGRAPQPVTFIVVWKPARVGSDVDPRSMAAFSGDTRPTAAGGPGFCGTYNYEAGGPMSPPASPLGRPQQSKGGS